MNYKLFLSLLSFVLYLYLNFDKGNIGYKTFFLIGMVLFQPLCFTANNNIHRNINGIKFLKNRFQ